MYGFSLPKTNERLTTYVLSQHTYVARVWVEKKYSIHLYNYEFWALINVKWRHLLKERVLLNVNHMEIVWLNKSIFFLNSDSEKSIYSNWLAVCQLRATTITSWNHKIFFKAKVVKSRKSWKITKRSNGNLRWCLSIFCCV